MAKLSVSCSWCHEFNELRNDGSKVYCWNCAHRADVPRVQCDCRKCRSMTPPNSIARKAAQYREAS
jgi:hypothetical protein